MFKSSRLFLYLGFWLIFLALICLPAKVIVVYGVDVDILYMGPIYALLIGIWSLPNLLLGVLESSVSKKSVLLRLTPILCLANIFMVGLIGDQMKYWRGNELQMLLNYSPFLIPCVIVNMIGLLYITKSEKLVKALKNPKVRMLLIIALTALPFFAAGTTLYSWWQATTL